MLTAFGFIWAGLMFLTAAANTALVVFADPVIWAKFNLLFPSISMDWAVPVTECFTYELAQPRRAIGFPL